jgi:hypothetical protein
MTQGLVIAPRPVVARNEAIQWPSHEGVDCHGAARLAMTKGYAARNDGRGARLAMTQEAAHPAMTRGLRSVGLAQQTPGGDVLG